MNCELPNSAIHQFNGSMTLSPSDSNEIPLDITSLLLRGSSLRNTRWLIGVVVYSGAHTKLVMNSRAAPFKISSIERTMNNILLVVLAALIFISAISLVFYIMWTSTYYDYLDYLCYNYKNSKNNIFRTDCESDSDYPEWGYFFTFFILYSNFLPISLYVTVEVCNFYQAYYIDNDLAMYDPTSDTPAVARTSNMNADLGMVEYIFSDKTGTLTENVMVFKRCSIAGTIYADGSKDAEKEAEKAGDITSKMQEEATNSSLPHVFTPLAHIRERSKQAGTALSEFPLIMALCHTVIVEVESGALQAESPDEKALVEAATELGWCFVGRRPGVVIVEGTSGSGIDSGSASASSTGKEGGAGAPRVEYELLATIPFDSDRKRMSVILRRPDGQVVVFCKGADNVMFERSTSFLTDDGRTVTNKEDVSERREQMIGHLNSFGSDGLRTLVFARRILKTEEYSKFRVAWLKAENAVVGRFELMVEAAALVERDLTVVGSSAIEDKLQDGVPQTLIDLGNAGIKLWVLTGDKTETAINIGYSAGLLTQEMVLIKLQDRGQDAAALKLQLESLIGLFRQVTQDRSDIDRIWTNMQNNVNEIIFGKKEKRSVLESVIPSSSGASGMGMRRRKTNSAAVADGLVPAGEESGAKVVASDDLEDTPLLRSVASVEGADSQGKGPSAPSSFSSSSSSSSGMNYFLSFMGGGSADQDIVDLDQLTSDHLAVVVDGDTLLKIFGDAALESLFLTLGSISKCVLACRVSPEQKRLAVRLVKKGIPGRPVTLAIGDGANDVAMIQEADIGIGVSGKEGRQAVNTSDFAIAQFRFLKRLLLVHGRLDYRRVCKVILFSFYKNIVLTLILFAFTFNSGYSGQSLFDDWIHSAYNVILAFPVISIGVFDKDMSEEMLERYSLLYISGRKRLDLNIPVLLLEMAQAILDSMIIFGIPYYCSIEPGDVWGKDAFTDGLWIFGTVVYTALVVSMFVRIAMITYTWTAYTHFFFWSSIVAYGVFLLIYQIVKEFSYNLFGVASEMAALPVVWWLIVLVPTGSATMELAITLFKREFFPTVADVVAEIDSGYGAFSDLLSFHKKKGRRGRGGGDDSPGGGGASGTGADALQSAAAREAEAALRYSRTLMGSSSKQMFPLDWISLQGLLDSLQPQEQTKLGVERTEENIAGPGSSFNFDHVATGSLHYISSALSAPLIFVSSSYGSSGIGGVRRQVGNSDTAAAAGASAGAAEGASARAAEGASET